MSTRQNNPEVIVIGSGPNGLAAAITLARAGHSVVVYEAEKTIGGGMRSAELASPGFLSDVCSSVHAMGAASSFIQSLPLEELGLRWVFPEAALAHPFDDGTAILLRPSLEETSAQFGTDATAVRRLLAPLIGSWPKLSHDLLGPPSFPRHPVVAARFGWNAIQPTTRLANGIFSTAKARAVFAGLAGHSVLPLENVGSSSFGIVLWILAHTTGWPFALGGSQAIANALMAYLEKLGGQVVPETRIAKLADLPPASAVLCDVTPRQFQELAQLSISDSRKLRNYRYGPGAFKLDWSLDAPIPWSAPECRKAGTVHLGCSLEEIAASERSAWSKTSSDRPFVLLTQPSLFDPTRAPAGKHVAWAYCHVPHASTEDLTERIEAQVERFAPGFKRHIIARSIMSPADLQSRNANLIGGDISGGALNLGQFLFGLRRRYSTSIKNVFLCSSSTPPGPGVHGLCGHYAAKLALKKCF